jgi:hypothetical protein
MTTKSEPLKNKILSSLTKTRTAILHEASQVPPEARDTAFLGAWSLKDLLSHLAGWDFTNMAAAKEVQAGKLPAFYAHHDSGWKTYNAGLVAQYRREDFNELLALVREAHNRLIEYLKTVPAEAFEQDFGVRSGRGYKVTIARLLHAEWKDEQEHLQQIRAFKVKL